MALIPNKSKSNHIADNGINIEVLMVLFAMLVIVQKVFENRIHSWLSWALILVVGVCGGYLLLPSSKNHGHIGYYRLMRVLRYKMQKEELKRKCKR
ncbi:MAG: hypothetical protein EOM50_07050 [Erysipelotrichia bacterium]|nr:hypothetical protein [Erysipelotrichia bacterium]NCC55026.1 hypothetical protein [Erysipelotrichia bacterium]